MRTIATASPLSPGLSVPPFLARDASQRRQRIQARVSNVAPHAALRRVGLACDESGGDLPMLAEGGLRAAGLSACPESVQAKLVIDLVQQQLLEMLAAGALDEGKMEVVVANALVVGLAG